MSSLIFTEIRFCIVHGRTLVALRHESGFALRLFNEASKDFFKPGFAQQLLHGGDTEELLLVGIKACLGNGAAYDEIDPEDDTPPWDEDGEE